MNQGVTTEESLALIDITKEMHALDIARVHDLNKMVETLEIDTIYQVLGECNGNQTHAATKLGIKRTCLIAKMKKYGIEFKSL